MSEDTRERFEQKFTIAEDGCWLWTAALAPNGYGVMRANGKTNRAHRISYELYKEAIPYGLQIDHLCRQRSCVNPAHLEAVTPAENTRRGLVTRELCEHGVGHSRCKKGCRADYLSAYFKEYREANKESLAENSRNYYAANKEQLAVKDHERYLKNRERKREYDRIRYEQKKEAIGE